MKKLMLASVAAFAMSGAASAEFINANGGSADLTLELSGNVEEICGITASSSTLDVDFGELAGTSGEVRRDVAFGLVCNSAGGISLGMTSANDGYLLRDGATLGDEGSQISYKVNLDPGSEAFTPSFTPGTPPLNLQTDRLFTLPGSASLREGREVGAAIALNGVQGPDFQGAPTTTVFAGAYSDTITVSLTAQ
jgi:spore coat protein U-like protein